MPYVLYDITKFSDELCTDIDTEIIVYIKPACCQKYIALLLLQLPAHTAPASTPLSLGIMRDLKAAPDKFGREIHCGAVEKSERHRVYEDIRGFDARMTKQTTNGKIIIFLAEVASNDLLIIWRATGS